MPKEKMLFSRSGLNSVRSSKLKEFRIMERNTFDGNRYYLEGLFNKKDTFEFGIFNTQEEAIIFLIGIHEKIEGSKK